MNGIMKSCIHPPGTKFVVTDVIKTVGYPPYTTGFISSFYNDSPAATNVVNMSTIIVRKGKRGKNRLETATVKVITFDNDTIWNKKIAIPRSLIVNVETMEQPLNILSMNKLDFIGWIMARIQHLKFLYKGYIGISKWKNTNTSISYSMLLNRPNEAIGVCNDQFKETLLVDLRKVETAVASATLRNKIHVIKKELETIAYLIWMDMIREKTGDKPTHQQKDLIRTFEHLRNVNKLCEDDYISHEKRRGREINKRDFPNVTTSIQLMDSIQIYVKKTEKAPNFYGVIYRKKDEKGWRK